MEVAVAPDWPLPVEPAGRCRWRSRAPPAASKAALVVNLWVNGTTAPRWFAARIRRAGRSRRLWQTVARQGW